MSVPGRERRGLRAWLTPTLAAPELLAAALAVAGATGACADPGASPSGRRPNVVLIVVDTLRKDRLGCYGHDGGETEGTPAIDRLAADGVRYERAISQAPWTLPSMAALMTSRQPGALGIVDERTALPPGVPLLSELLGELGYVTAAIVSNRLCSSRYDFHRGFDHFDESAMLGHSGVSSATLSDAALEFLEVHGERPFFLWLHYFDPHERYVLHGADEGRSGRPAKERELESVEDRLRAYESEVAYTDRHVGVVLERLRDLGLYENSLIVFTSDHGEEFLDHGGTGHSHTLFGELVEVPLLVKFPHGEPGVVADPVALLDVLPTVADLLGVEPSPGVEGRSLLGGAPARRTIFTETHKKGARLRAAVAGAHKLIADLDDGGLAGYDLAADPGEERPVDAKEDPAFADLRRALADWGRSLDGVGRSATEIDLDAAELERLQRLGYAGE